MENAFLKHLYQEHQKALRLPEPSRVCGWLNGLLGILFPEFSDHRFKSQREFAQYYQELCLELNRILKTLDASMLIKADVMEQAFMEQIPEIRETLLMDAQAICQGDPAAVDLTEVIRTYPGFYAIAVYRLAHTFFELDVPLIPRILTEYAHSKTGIDIHPAARIGSRFCIDHGTGVVIGGSCDIGSDVKIYQGVTLGALSVKKEMANTKRHPTIEDRVVIYAGATILGGGTTIGHDAIIGGNVWITKSVPAHCRIYYTGYLRQRHKDGKEETQEMREI